MKGWNYLKSKELAKDPILQSTKTESISFIFSKTTVPEENVQIDFSGEESDTPNEESSDPEESDS